MPKNAPLREGKAQKGVNMNMASKAGLATHSDLSLACGEPQELQMSAPPKIRPLARGHRKPAISIQLEPGTLRIESTMRRFDGLLVERTAANRTALHRVRAPWRSVSLLLGAADSRALFVEGHSLARDCCVILDAGAQVELIARPSSSWILISLDNAAAACTSQSIVLHAGARLIRRSMDVCYALQLRAADALFEVAGHSAGSALRTLAMRMLHDPGDATAGAAALHAMRAERARRRLAIERARKYISEHLTDPIRLADLCAHAHVQARSLEYGFRELMGICPIEYVRMLRLAAVRTQLLDDAATSRTISEIALDAGFSHLSQFVVDYKRVFGETPSATRRRTVNSCRFEVSQQPEPLRDALFVS
jgi:AraC-like DNA-binding protein